MSGLGLGLGGPLGGSLGNMGGGVSGASTSLPGGALDSTSAAATWLLMGGGGLGGRTTPLQPSMIPPPPLAADASTSVDDVSAAAAAVAVRGKSFGAVSLEDGEKLCVDDLASAGASLRANSVSPMPSASFPSASGGGSGVLVRPVAAPAGSRLPSQVRETRRASDNRKEMSLALATLNPS